MIFVTVGTHEQPFDRLISCIDRLKRDGVIQEEVIIQTGFGTYEPQHCRWSKMLPYEEMVENVEKARIVITHGGPASFIMPLQMGKIPIVVPRQSKFGEHVNDHQLEFAKAMEQRQGNVIVIEDIEDLEDTLLNYDSIVASMPASLNNNNARFVSAFKSMVDELFAVTV